MILGPIGFAAPLALLGLLVVPVLWWLLRVTPPQPRLVRFPAIRLLRDLVQPEETSSRTPLWLILLRTALALALILGLAQPILHPARVAASNAPLLVVVDNGWGAAPAWPQTKATLDAALEKAMRSGRVVTVLATAAGADGSTPLAAGPDRASVIAGRIRSLQPMPWAADRAKAATALAALKLPKDAETLWLSDGLGSPDADGLAARLAGYAQGSLYRPASLETAQAVMQPQLDAGKLAIRVVRASFDGAENVELRASTLDGRMLSTAMAQFKPGNAIATAKFDLPVEIANEVDRIDLAVQHSAGGTTLLDSRWRRHSAGLVTLGGTDQGLLQGETYLSAALQPYADLHAGSLADLLKKKLATIVLDDSTRLSDQDIAQLRSWVEQGGVLVRFAGPNMAASPDALLPVALHGGDRALGGSLSWVKPAHLAPFPADGPFAGMPVPTDVTVSTQVLAQPDPDLAKKTWAALTDGTPLVTAKAGGKGLIVLFHTTASPEWSNLCLSGLFPDMLRRIGELANGGEARDGPAATTLMPDRTLDGFGMLGTPTAGALAIPAATFDATVPGPTHPPGYYGAEGSRRALNLGPHLPALSRLPDYPGLHPMAYGAPAERSLAPLLLVAVLVLLAVDTLAALWLKGLLALRVGYSVLVLLILTPGLSQAQTSARDAAAATTTTLAYVRTGDATVDASSDAGLKMLAQILMMRTSIDHADAQGVNLETDDLAFYPLLYWPVTGGQGPPSGAAAAKVNAYLATGGMILFDTRHGDANDAAALKQITEGISIPALERIPDGHTLSKSFYLLKSFPGRYTDGPLWVEAAPSDHNDNVSSVIVGGNDWADAWASRASDSDGAAPVDLPGGEDQRETAWRFGVNLVMYALTGNYKSDQVHTPAILERLGK